MAETTYIEAITQAMAEEMERDERVFLIGEDVGAYGGAFKTSYGLIDRFGPERVVDTPISEIAIIGDGGSSTGAFWEGMNFAVVQKLPMVVVVEDNGYAYSTPTSKQTAAKTLADKSYAFGCHGVTVDGNDVLAVYGETKRAVERARNGEGVTLLEVKTFRMKGHAEHDNQAYVPKELIDEWQQKDAVPRFEKVLLELGVATQQQLADIQQRVKREIDDATDEADRSPMPNPADAARGLYIEDGYWNG